MYGKYHNYQVKENLQKNIGGKMAENSLHFLILRNIIK
jgi:hypothetical protein